MNNDISTWMEIENEKIEQFLSQITKMELFALMHFFLADISITRSSFDESSVEYKLLNSLVAAKYKSDIREFGYKKAFDNAMNIFVPKKDKS